nr:immunoglobulin heavy chain junction region [Mus musculus]
CARPTNWDEGNYW